MTNPYFNFKEESEQDLVEDLVTESIEIHGEDFMYIPRKLVSPDEILGEDRFSKFEHAYPITAYMENANGFEGQGAFIQRFGGMINYSATLLIARRKWEQLVGQFGQTILPNRPCEGDLIYYPLTDSMFEIKYVDDKNPFAQLGAFYTYKLTIELFQYSSERFETDYKEINDFESLKTFDQNAARSAWGGVMGVEIEDAGLGYTSEPYIEVVSVAGANACFHTELNEDGSIKSVEVMNPGDRYRPDDYAIVHGDCERQALLKLKIRTQVELAGDKWASNSAFIEKQKEEVFDPSNPFGE